MLGLFKKKKDENVPENTPAEGDSSQNPDQPSSQPSPTSTSGGGGTAELVKISTDIDRLKASVESFSEVRKSLQERISMMSEQIGELRAMILDRDRTIQGIELKAIKAADLVETVQPEKLMLELQKEDAKFEALKANLEGNESIQERVMEELRELRRKLDFFRGVEEVVKLSEEVKKELIEVKKVEASININADKIETMYTELRKRYQDADAMFETLHEIKAHVEQNTKDIEAMKTKITEFARKEDVDKLIEKMQRYADTLKELGKTTSLSRDITRLKSLLDGMKQ